MTHSMRKQSGFTLVEIAIVLVIIGLLLGGVLKGQAMIENAKIKALASEMRAVSTMVNGYRDVFKALPGDDANAVADMAGAAQATAATAGNGGIDTGTWVGAPTIVTGNESSVFWNHVRLANLATGSATSGDADNAVNGKLGITSNAAHPDAPANTSATYFVCSSKIPGRLAKSVDLLLDDGIATTGQLFASVEAGGLPVTASKATAAYVDSNFYTICLAQ